MLELMSNEAVSGARIIVVGVGGAGNNAVNRMISDEVGGVEFICINTDSQVLKRSKAPQIMQVPDRKSVRKLQKKISKISRLL